MTQKRLVSVQDISCMGRCSLTVALPIISAAGIETSIIPTAVLSTHTGGFDGYTFHDLTDDIPEITKHWKGLSRHFDCIYTGYLGSVKQTEYVKEFAGAVSSPDTLLFIDPVMGDNGKLYRGFDDVFVEEMKKFCFGADILIPNITEAALLAGVEYKAPPHDKDYIGSVFDKLEKYNAGTVIITGVGFRENELGAVGRDYKTGESFFAMSENLPGAYHGAGDVFASSFISMLLNSFTPEHALEGTVDFISACISHTHEKENVDLRYGLYFEEKIPDFLKILGKI